MSISRVCRLMRIGVCQHSCSIFYATFFNNSDGSSGFSVTESGRLQSIWRQHLFIYRFFTFCGITHFSSLTSPLSIIRILSGRGCNCPDRVGIERRFNNRPRLCLDMQTPNQVASGLTPSAALEI